MGVTCFVEDASVVAVQQRVSYSCFALHCYWWGIRVPCRCRAHRPREEDAPSGVCFVATERSSHAVWWILLAAECSAGRNWRLA